LLSLSACSPHVRDANLREVKPDMSTKEVESILGQPKRIDSSTELKSTEVRVLPVVRYEYEQDGHKVSLTFVGDRLAENGIDGSFEGPTPAVTPADNRPRPASPQNSGTNRATP